MVRETWVQSQVASYQRLKKMVLDTSLLNTQQCKVRIKGKVEQYKKRSSAIEKGAFGSPSTTVAKFLLTLPEKRMRGDLIETFKIIDGISYYNRHLF